MNTQKLEQTAKTEATAITTNYFRMNHVKKFIEGSEYHFKLSGMAGTPQYYELMGLMAAKPDYELIPFASEKKAKKQTYKGLNMALIKKWVAIKGDATQNDVLANLIEDGNTYPTIKSWLLDTFEIVSVDKMVREIQEENLAEAKRKAMRVRVNKVPNLREEIEKRA